MKRSIICLMVMLLVLNVPVAITNANTNGDWTLLKGGFINNSIKSFSADENDNGITFEGQGSYSFSGEAVGAVYQKAVELDSFKIELALEKVAGWNGEGVDNWININLLNKASYFSLSDPKSNKGLNIFLRPVNSGELAVEIYRISEPQPGDEQDFVPGWKGIGGQTIKTPWNNTITIEIQNLLSGESKIAVNRQEISTDTSSIKSSWFANNKGYFSIGASAGNDATYRYTLKSINDQQANLSGSNQPVGFKDTTGHWAAAAIEEAVKIGFVNGYEDNTFRPNNPVKRSEYVSLLNKALSLPASMTVKSSFTDIPSNAWYIKEAITANELKLVQGTSTNTFSPNQNITREQIAVILMRAYSYKFPDHSLPNTQNNKLSDEASIATWAKTAVNQIVELGFMDVNSSNKFDPKVNATRAEAASALLKLINAPEPIVNEENVETIKLPVEQWIDAPTFTYAPNYDGTDGVKAIFYDGLNYNGKATKVFAYIGMPKQTGNEPVPAVVLVHGGLGTAFKDWVKQWNDKGYAAIAMDLEGNLPIWKSNVNAYERNPNGGPTNQAWRDLAQPIENQWTYHAIANVVLANSLIRSLPNVDVNKVGITGVSWGGLVTSLAIGHDDRFSFAIPVYGSGYVHESESYFGTTYRSWSKETRQKFMSLWEPSNVLPKADLPMLWVNGDSDEHFPLTVFSKTYQLVQSLSRLSVQPGMIHGQEYGTAPNEIYAFADSVVKGGQQLLHISSHKYDATQNKAIITYDSPSAIKAVDLYYVDSIADRLKPQWKKQTVPLKDISKTLTISIPAQAKAYYINLTDSRGLIVSSELTDIK